MDSRVSARIPVETRERADEQLKKMGATTTQLMGDAQLWARPHSFPDISHTLRRAIPARRLERMMLKSLEFIDICTVGQDDVRSSLEAAWNDSEDALVKRCAARGQTRAVEPATTVPGDGALCE